ncbi:MAG: NAD(P)-dependent oxidoreductase, partial [Clostridia bacterium]
KIEEVNMNAAILTDNYNDARRVFDEKITQQLRSNFDIESKIFTKENVLQGQLAQVETIFATWGMPHFSCEEIKQYLPKLQYVFYAAGSVQAFAKEFLQAGIRVCSAWQANAIPVAEFAFAQIVLAAKGFYRASKHCKLYYNANKFANSCGGNYNNKIGILGVGSIGSMICEKLKTIDCEVYYYDPFLDASKAEQLGIKQASLQEIFSNCNIVSNHLANKEELNNVLNYSLFKLMPRYATFINTGRGKQVNERELCKALKQDKTRTALLDVTCPEPSKLYSPIRRRKNIVVTPHIAGSLGKEVVRMAQYMLDDALKIQNGESPKFEVTLQMLATMA